MSVQGFFWFLIGLCVFVLLISKISWYILEASPLSDAGIGTVLSQSVAGLFILWVVSFEEYELLIFNTF